MFSYGIEESGSGSSRRLTLHLGGEVTFAHLDEMQRVLNNVLHVCSHLVINAELVRKADVSLFMLLCVTHSMAILQKKKLSVIGSLPRGAITQSEYLVYSRQGSCLMVREGECRYFKTICGEIGTEGALPAAA